VIHGKTPTKAEKEWMDKIVRLGCIVCRTQNRGYVPALPHHLLNESGHRIGHMHTIPLCDPGHHQGAPKSSGEVSRHPNKARFEAKYGTEEFLLEVTQEAVRRYIK
jgi:hypothetical protein